jgi:transposase
MIPDELATKILRLHLVEGWPVGTIAKELGVHHETVTRVLRDAGIERPKLHPRSSMADPFIPFILETLREYPKLPASRLFHMIRERGYPGKEDHFRTIIAGLRPKPPAEAYLRLRTLPGEEAQVDWAHFGTILIDGYLRPLVAFIMVLSWCRRIFLRFGVDMRMGAFLAHHVAAFIWFDGIARRLLYDNLKSAVLERIGDAIRFNPTLLSFAAHHRYEPRPVAPYRGNEKARVERGVRYVRTSFFAGRKWKDLDDLNAQALAWCEGLSSERRCPDDPTLSVGEAWEQERGLLLPLPSNPFPIEDRVDVRVGKTPYARFDLNDYTVPHNRVQRTLTVLATQDTVRILDGLDVVASHRRCWGRHRQIEDPAHLAALVEWKRQAREGRAIDRLYHAAPASRSLLVQLAQRGGNIGAATSALLRLLDAYGAEALEEAIGEALKRKVPHYQAVRQCLERRRQEAGQPPSIPIQLPDDPRVREIVVKPHALEAYDRIAAKKEDDHDE